MPQPETIFSIQTFITEHFPAVRRRILGLSDPLLQGGVIDSMGILDMVAHLETEFGISIVDEDLVPEHFWSIEAIAEFVETRRARHSAPNGKHG